MRGYAICSACVRHVKIDEGTCPFCGATLEGRAVAAASPPRRRVSRGEWLARGSALALLGCSNSVGAGPQGGADATAVEASTTTPEGSTTIPEASSSGGGVEDTPEAATLDGAPLLAEAGSADATVDASPAGIMCADGGAVPLAFGQGPFECAQGGTSHDTYDDAGRLVDSGLSDAPLFCNRATQYCLVTGNFYHCNPVGGLGWLCSPPDASSATCDSGVVRCACGSWGQGSCNDDDAGGLTYWAPCYGAPPSRFERLARHRAAVA
jgi:hypothetical protein